MKIQTDLETNWHETKGLLQRQFPILTEEDLVLEPDKQDEMLARLEAKLGYTKDQIHELINRLPTV